MSQLAAYPPGSAAAQGLASCHICLKVAPADERTCPRCGAALHLRIPNSLQRTVALLLTATVLYIPANLLPIMNTAQLGTETESTILGGVILLWEMNSYPVATIIFVASVVVPVAKLLVLSWLCWSVLRRHRTSELQRTNLYRITEFIGRWSMVDVFVVTVLVALIHLGGIMRVTPGLASLAFGVMVMVTMLAAETFDPRLIWDVQGEDSDE